MKNILQSVILKCEEHLVGHVSKVGIKMPNEFILAID